MSYVRVTPQADTPITLAEAKLQLRSFDTTEDSLILSKINAATQIFEIVTNRALMQQTWEWRGIDWPGLMWLLNYAKYSWPVDIMIDVEGYMRLRPGPLIAINSIKYYDAN